MRRPILATALVLGFAVAARTELPKPVAGAAMSITHTDLDRMVLETLKEIHNRGAASYNAGDHAAAFRLYEGAIITVKPFLAHRPKIQALIADGIEQVDKSIMDPKVKAFRLHEVIEQVRTDLKAELKQELPTLAAIAGKVTLGGQPLGGIALAYTASGAKSSIASATTAADGTFTVLAGVPAGTYTVTLLGNSVPTKFAKIETSPIKVEFKTGANPQAYELK